MAPLMSVGTAIGPTHVLKERTIGHAMPARCGVMTAEIPIAPVRRTSPVQIGEVLVDDIYRYVTTNRRDESSDFSFELLAAQAFINT